MSINGKFIVMLLIAASLLAACTGQPAGTQLPRAAREQSICAAARRHGDDAKQG